MKLGVSSGVIATDELLNARSRGWAVYGGCLCVMNAARQCIARYSISPPRSLRCGGCETTSNHFATLRVEGCTQRSRSVPRVVMRAALNLTGTHRRGGRRALQRLSLAPLVHAQHQRLVGRAEVQPDNMPHLLDEQRSLRQLERARAVRLQREGLPDARHSCLAEATPLRQRARALVRRVDGQRLQRRRQRLLHHRVGNLPRGLRLGFVEQARTSTVNNPLLPTAHRWTRYAFAGGDRAIGQTLTTRQHEPRAGCQSLGGRPATRPVHQPVAPPFAR